MINEKLIEKAKQKIKSTKEKPLIIMAKDDQFNRKIIEYGKFDILMSIEKGERKNKLRQVDSGLNQVVSRIATKNKVAIGIDLIDISKEDKLEKANRIAKIIQNIKICRKYKTNIAVRSENKREAEKFLLSIGSSTQQIKEATFFN